MPRPLGNSVASMYKTSPPVSVQAALNFKAGTIEIAGQFNRYGARPLKRAIQKELETPLGKLLLKGEVADGQKVIVDREARGALKFIVVPGEASKRDTAAAAARFGWSIGAME
jgi:hypothetical protein